MRIKGDQLTLFARFGESLKAIGASTDCTISLMASTESISSISTGAWLRVRAKKKSWSVSTSGFYFEDSSLPTSLLGAVRQVGAEVDIAVSVLGRQLVEAGYDINTISPDSTYSIVGKAIVTHIKMSGSRGNLATYNIDFSGSGELAPIGV